MKKFASGFLIGVIVASMIGVLAASYVAEPADFKVLVNGEEFNSDPPALMVDGRTYLPLRAIGDALGVPVNWNEELRQAEVGTPATNVQAEAETAMPSVNINNTTQSNDKWKMTYLNYKQESAIDDYTKADEGKEFLMLFFEIENISSETQNFSGLFNSDFYIDSFKTPQSLVGYHIDDAVQLTAVSVEPGKKVKGYFAFQVNTDWKKAEIIYNEDLLKEDNENIMSFLITKE